MVEITDAVIDTAKLLDAVQDTRAGAVVLFVGTTREVTGGRRTESLDYECFPEMALQQMQSLIDQAGQTWDIVRVGIIHRVGHLELGEASVAVAVSTPHRAAAFEAAQWIMDRLKQVVPIWKKENWADGTSQWVHPGNA